MTVPAHYGASNQQQARRVPASARGKTSASFAPGKNSTTKPSWQLQWTLSSGFFVPHKYLQATSRAGPVLRRGCQGAFETSKSRQGPGTKQKILCTMCLSCPQHWCISLHGVTGLEKKGTLIRPQIGRLRLLRESWWPWCFISYTGVWYRGVLVGSAGHTSCSSFSPFLKASYYQI